MNFSPNETAQLQAALTSYNAVHRGYYGKKLQNELVTSALEKLSAKAPRDSFSNRECAVMFLALNIVCEALDADDIQVPDAMLGLLRFLKIHAAGELEIVSPSENLIELMRKDNVY